MVARSGTTPDGFRWKLAPCLVVLEDEINARHPDRAKRSDGSIASAAHSKQNPSSDHEADRGDGMVKAIDLTDDPPRFDPDDLCEQIRLRRDGRVKYMISDRRICRSYAKPNVPAWTWSPYTGSNAHESHAHISVTDAGANDTSTWFPAGTPPQEDEIVFTVAEAADYVRDAYVHITGREASDVEVYLWAHAIADDAREMWKMQQRLVGEAIRASR